MVHFLITWKMSWALLNKVVMLCQVYAQNEMQKQRWTQDHETVTFLLVPFFDMFSNFLSMEGLLPTV